MSQHEWIFLSFLFFPHYDCTHAIDIANSKPSEVQQCAAATQLTRLLILETTLLVWLLLRKHTNCYLFLAFDVLQWLIILTRSSRPLKTWHVKLRVEDSVERERLMKSPKLQNRHVFLFKQRTTCLCSRKRRILRCCEETSLPSTGEHPCATKVLSAEFEQARKVGPKYTELQSSLHTPLTRDHKSQASCCFTRQHPPCCSLLPLTWVYLFVHHVFLHYLQKIYIYT